MAGSDVPGKLRALAKLHKSGDLTDDEFATEKARLIESIGAPEPATVTSGSATVVTGAGAPWQRTGAIIGGVIVAVLAVLWLLGGSGISKGELESSMEDEFGTSGIQCVEKGSGGSSWACAHNASGATWSVSVESDGSWVAEPSS